MNPNEYVQLEVKGRSRVDYTVEFPMFDHVVKGTFCCNIRDNVEGETGIDGGRLASESSFGLVCLLLGAYGGGDSVTAFEGGFDDLSSHEAVAFAKESAESETARNERHKPPVTSNLDIF